MSRIFFTVVLLSTMVMLLVSFTREPGSRSLREIYSGPPSGWPVPRVKEGVTWAELGPLPYSPFDDIDSLKQLQELGKRLFFDNRLSGSGKISCASCHRPELSWTDGKSKSEGHEGSVTRRNAPSIQNAWYYEKLFWDGRSRSLEDQAFGPINSETEMHGDMPDLPRRLRKIRGYAPLFEAAFGDPGIDPDRITSALAAFQRTISSAESRFDRFLKGDKRALSKSELRGLHIFRTEAGCMNCHYGPMFTDNSFHNNGFAAGDEGLYFVTHKPGDKGKLKTPSLRDVGFTGPWMHDGSQDRLIDILERYSNPPENSDTLLSAFRLSGKSRDLLAFLQAISAPPKPFVKPVLPE